MIGPSRLILTKRTDSKTNYSNLLGGLTLLLIWVVLSSCVSNGPGPPPGTNKKPDPPALAKAKGAQRKAEDAMKETRRAQEAKDALLSLHPMRQTAQQRPQDRDQQTEDVSQPASLPPR